METQLPNLNTPEFWEQIREELHEHNDNWCILCSSPTFKFLWKLQEVKDTLRLLGQQFLDDIESSPHRSFFFMAKESILLFFRSGQSENWFEKGRNIRWDFIEWNLKRIQTLTTLAQ